MNKQIKSRNLWAAAAAILIVGTSISMSDQHTAIGSDLAAAVANRDIDEVEGLLTAGANPDDRDHIGEEAILSATASDQFRIANLLADHGANIWATDELGFTPGNFTAASIVLPDSIEGRARERFIERLRAAGYPWPPHGSNDVMALRSAGQWPPHSAKDVHGRPLRP